MGVDVNQANAQAAQLQQYAESLKTAKQNLQSYKTEITINWAGKETTYIHSGIDQVITQLDSLIVQLQTIQGDVVTTAAQIRQEEIAREEAERQARIAAAAAAAAEAARITATQAAAQTASTQQNSTQQSVKKPSTSSNSRLNTQKNNSFFGWFSSLF